MRKLILLFAIIMLVGCASPATPTPKTTPNGESAWYACLQFIRQQVGAPIEKAQRYDPSRVEVGESGIFWKVDVYYAYNDATYTCGIGWSEEKQGYALLAFEY